VTRLGLKNPLFVLMLALAVLAFAALVTPRMSMDTFPELAPPVLVIGTKASGMGPTEVEKTITWRLEKAVSATPGVDHVQSISRNGLSVIYVWLKWGTDLNSAQSLVQQQVAFAMSSIPKTLGIIPPFVLQYDPSNAPVAQVAVYGGELTAAQLYDYAANNISPLIEGVPGVASASPNGGKERQINVIIDPVKAAARGLTSSDVAAAVDRSNALLPSGRMTPPTFSANVYTNAVPHNVREIGEAAVKVRNGKPVLIRDVARVEDGGSKDAQAVTVDGKTAVYLNVLRVPGGNVIAIVDAIKDIVHGLKDVPPGVKVVPIFDQSLFVRSTLSGLEHELIQVLLLISVVILVFLQSARSVLIAAVSVPVALSAVLIALYVTGQSLNAFTLGGMTLAMGPLVDISVVVLESIHRKRHEGLSPLRAALDGARAVAVPALAAMLCTLAVLMPVALLSGLAARLFTPLAITVATGMIAGYVVSMLVTPVACRYLLGNEHKGRLGLYFEGAIERLAAGYANVLRRVLPYGIWVVGAALVLVSASIVAATRLPSSFFPEIDEGMERVYVRLAPGTSLEEANEKIVAMGETLRRELPEGMVDLVLTNVGSPSKARSAMTSPNYGTHMGFIRLALSDAAKRDLSQGEIAERMRAILTRDYPGVDFLQAPGGLVASVFSNGYIAPLVVEVRGNDLASMLDNSRRVADVARTVAGIRDVYLGLELDYPEIRVANDRQISGMLGVDAKRAAQATLEATLGNVNTPSVWVDANNGQSYYVITYHDDKVISDARALAEVPVYVSKSGSAVTLGAYGTIQRGAGPVLVERNQLTRAAHIYMQTERRDLGSAAAELEQKLRSNPGTQNLEFSFVGQVDLMRTTFSGLGVTLAMAVMLVFMIMVTQFKSLRLPLIMLFAVPGCLFGIVLALLLAGQGFSTATLMGILMVIGISVSNGILLVDHARLGFERGMERSAAVLEAARARFVPIAMTSLATIIGLLPTALGIGEAAASNRPLALAVVGGLTSSTLMSLFLVPVMFVWLAKQRQPEAAEDLAALDPQPSA
jgi:multidrug efflux pump subunit AcrB